MNSNPRLRVTLMGQISHNEVLRFFKNHPIDVFVNLSTIEGVPVSIMESISFGIPAVATDVGATNEIVNSQTGILLSPNPECKEVADAILTIADKDLHPRHFWANNYNSIKNYTETISIIKSLK